LASAVLAHHSTSMHDRAAPVTIEAEVVEFRWVNPHSYLTVGRIMTYRTELPTD
jgi:hypothetical protein